MYPVRYWFHGLSIDGEICIRLLPYIAGLDYRDLKIFIRDLLFAEVHKDDDYSLFTPEQLTREKTILGLIFEYFGNAFDSLEKIKDVGFNPDLSVVKLAGAPTGDLSD